MNYLDECAARIRHEIPDDLLPDQDTIGLFRIYAVLALALGPAVQPRDVHNAWAAWMSETRPDHPSLVPYEDLPRELQAQDAPFVDAIRRASQRAG